MGANFERSQFQECDRQLAQYLQQREDRSQGGPRKASFLGKPGARAGRPALSREAVSLSFLAGANSIFVGEKLLSTPNPDRDEDDRLFNDLCSEKLNQYLVNRARTFLFSTALPPYVAAHKRASIRLAASADLERAQLARLASFLGEKIAAGFGMGRTDTQIIPIYLGESERAVRYSDLLNEAGFGVRPIRPPSVPPGTARLRISLNANLSIDALARIADVLVSIREHDQVSVEAARP